jgi:hypothetical protein
MFRSFGENFQLGIDCVAAAGNSRQVVYGWHMTPRGMPVDVSFSTPDGRACRVCHVSRHARTDVMPQDPGAATVGGFSIIVAVPHAARGLIMTIAAGDEFASVNLDTPATTDLFAANETRDWGVTFSLLRECIGQPELMPLLHYQYRPFGAFAGWMAHLPVVQGEAEHIGIVARVACTSSPAGEVALDLQFIGRSRGTVGIDAVAIARLRSDDGGPDEIALMPFHDALARHVPAASTFYGRLGWEHVARLRGLDLIVQITFDDERIWLRCQPRVEPVPGFLDALAAAVAGQTGETSLLSDVIERRTALVTALIEAEQDRAARMAATPSLDHPELALVGVDDAPACRLLHLLAPELEASVTRIMLLGEAAEPAAQTFNRRGLLPAVVVREAGAILTRVAEIGPANLVAVDVPALAVAAIEGSVPALLRRARVGGLGYLLLLHALAGPTRALGDSLARYSTQLGNPDQPWLPVAHDWQSALAAELVNAHLEAIWQQVTEPSSQAGSPGPAAAPLEIEA